MSAPLYQLKAEFFKTLGHPARIRVLELLSEREHSVGEMLPEVGVEAANLSQHLAVLRRTGLVTTRKEGSSVFYSLTSPEVAELLRQVRRLDAHLREHLGHHVLPLAEQLQHPDPGRVAQRLEELRLQLVQRRTHPAASLARCPHGPAAPGHRILRLPARAACPRIRLSN